MRTYQLPDDFLDAAGTAVPDVVIRRYESSLDAVKNRIVLGMNMINLLISGTKTVLHPEGTTCIRGGELLLLPAGNIITSEVRSGTALFSSVLLYFSNNLLDSFLHRYDTGMEPPPRRPQPFLQYTQDDFIRRYIQSLLALLHSPAASPAISRLKVEELLLYLFQNDFTPLRALQGRSRDTSGLLIQKTAEAHICAPVTVDELAFLCNMSSSTFKRRFGALYGTSPQKWLTAERLRRAAELLQDRSERPSQVYYKIGYQNHSSFSEAFRQLFGMTPSAYQAAHLDVRP